MKGAPICFTISVRNNESVKGWNNEIYYSENIAHNSKTTFQIVTKFCMLILNEMSNFSEKMIFDLLRQT